VVAPSAAGKNRAVDEALALIPPEAVYILKAGSPRALIYTGEDFQHRVVVVSEADSIPEDGPAASAIRTLAADNVMEYEVVEKNPKTGRFEVRIIRKPGPTGLITTSTKSLGEQLGTRLLEVPVSDDEHQTRAVMKAHARDVAASKASPPDVTPFLALQRWLGLQGGQRIIVPFADALSNLVPAKAVRMRRDFRQLLTSIQAFALLYQRQRETTADGGIVATLEDYRLARELLAPIFEGIAAEGLTPAIRQTVEKVKPGEEVSLADLAQRLGLAKATVSYRVKRAIAGGWLVNNEPRQGHPAKLELGAPLPDSTMVLPDAQVVQEVFERSNRTLEPSKPLEQDLSASTANKKAEVFKRSSEPGEEKIAPPCPVCKSDNTWLSESGRRLYCLENGCRHIEIIET
jgi:MarR family